MKLWRLAVLLILVPIALTPLKLSWDVDWSALQTLCIPLLIVVLGTTTIYYLPRLADWRVNWHYGKNRRRG